MKHILVNICIFHSSTPDLGQPVVSVMSDGTSTAGETFSLGCMVETVEGVRSGDISIVWMGPNGSDPIGDRTRIGGSVTRRTLAIVFSPLHTSDRGQYTCTGRIADDSVGVDVSSTSSVEINVISECCRLWKYCIPHTYVVHTSSVPAPDVSVSLNTDDTVYQGTELVISCTVTVDSAVDTGFDVIMTWKSVPQEAMNGPYVTITNTSGSGHEYCSTVTISPVNTTDSATYSCTASVTPTTTQSGPNMERTRRVNIAVRGEMYLMIRFWGVELVSSLLQS